MKLNYKEFIEGSKIPESAIYLIHGSPRHLQNEIERKIQNYFKRFEFLTRKNFVIDSDFPLNDFRKELEINTLFKENRIITLNIVSNSVPQKVKDIIMETKIPDDLKILIKLDRQTSAFKKTKFYEYLLKSHNVIEIFELTGSDLRAWVGKKFATYNLKFNEEVFKKIIEKTEGNTLAIIQEIYKMSLAEIDDVDSYFDIVQNDYKFSEFDLVNSLHNLDLSKSLKILKYLQEVNFPSVYLLFLLNSELKKIYNLAIGNKLNIYIPNFKIKNYDFLLTKVNPKNLIVLIEYCHNIDKSIKTGVGDINLWHQLEILISCFILNKSIEDFIGKEAC